MSISYAVFCLKSSPHPRNLHSFPTRRSSDLGQRRKPRAAREAHRRVPPRIRWCTASSRPSCVSRYIGKTRLMISAVPYQETSRSGLSQAECRSEEHTSELQSHVNLVCRLLLEIITTPPQSTLFPYTTLFRSRTAPKTPGCARGSSPRPAAHQVVHGLEQAVLCQPVHRKDALDDLGGPVPGDFALGIEPGGVQIGRAHV